MTDTNKPYSNSGFSPFNLHYCFLFIVAIDFSLIMFLDLLFFWFCRQWYPVSVPSAPVPPTAPPIISKPTLLVAMRRCPVRHRCLQSSFFLVFSTLITVCPTSECFGAEMQNRSVKTTAVLICMLKKLHLNLHEKFNHQRRCAIALTSLFPR